MRNAVSMAANVLRKILGPVAALVILIALYTGYKVYLAPKLAAKLQVELAKYIGTLFIVILTYNVQKAVQGALAWYREKIAVVTQTRLDDELLPLVSRLAKVCLWVIAIVLILPLYGVNISALIATLGVGSLAIALAAQDTIANFISGFMIMLDRPFDNGDTIKLPSGEVVKVLEVGIRRSKFLAEDHSVIILPNLELSKSKIVNITLGEELRKT